MARCWRTCSRATTSTCGASPSPRFHANDGGPLHRHRRRLIIQRDPDSGFINVGTYRMQVHDRDLLGLWISPASTGA